MPLYYLVAAHFRGKNNPTDIGTSPLHAAHHATLLTALSLSAAYADHPLESLCGSHAFEATNMEEAFALAASFVSARLTALQRGSKDRVVIRRIPLGLCSITPKGHVGHGCMGRMGARGDVSAIVPVPEGQCVGVEFTIIELGMPTVQLPAPESDWL